MKRYRLDRNVLIQLVNKTPGYGLVESRLGSAQAHSVLVSAVTDNTGEFSRVKGLVLENWRRPQG